MARKENPIQISQENEETATLAGGCFWCTEAIFQRLKGVKQVTSGYTGGEQKNPSYEQVSTGTTGHAEAVQIKYNPDIISYEKLLEIYFATHDPTTLNRQGADKGRQYRSAIYFHNHKQKKIAEKMIKDLNQKNIFPDPIVTELVASENFYPAETPLQNFYNKQPLYPYCTIIIDPKIKKLIRKFGKDVAEKYLK